MKCDLCIDTARFYEDTAPTFDLQSLGLLTADGNTWRSFYCARHALERATAEGSRLKALLLRCPRCGRTGPWDAWTTNPRQGTLQCGTCARRGLDVIPEFVQEGKVA